MSRDANEIADRLRAAYLAGPDEAQALQASLFADEVELRHSPPLPSDGPVEASFLKNVSALEGGAIGRAIPDMTYDDVDVTVDGDQVHVRTTVTGTMADGKPVRLTTNVLLEVRDEHIVGLEGRLAPEDQQVIGELLVAGGFELPPEILEHYAGAEGST